VRITLLQRLGKVSAEDFNAALDEVLSNLKGELSASTKFVGFSDNGWAEIEIDGEDCEILQEIISRKLARAQTDLSQIETQENYPGILRNAGADLAVDIGIENPAPLNVNISLKALRAQLCDGKPLSGREIAEYYCLSAGGRATVRITRLERGARRLEGWLADSQIELFSELIASRLDRVEVFDCTLQRLGLAVRKARLERDVISVESSSLTTHSVVCKLGTDAIGLIPRLGSMLRKSELKPFLPRRILAKCRDW
jgi:hypothetical protein